MKQRRVVVTGMGALTPIGNNLQDYWKNLKAGKSGAAPITYFDTTNHKTKFACEIKDFDPMDYLDRKEVRTNDPYVQYALISVDEALKDSGIDLDQIDRYRAGVIWGTGNGGIQSFHNEIANYAKGDGTPRFNPYFVPKILANMASGIVSIKHGLKGITYTPVSACATSNTALIEAFYHIQWNKADVVVSGGSDAVINESGIAGFNASKALSTRNEDPSVASRPFDKDRDGFVMGEGAGALILEELEHAQARGANIYAEIVGGAMTSDAFHLTATHPEGEGAQRGMRLALEEGGLTPADVDYVNMHATSTPMGDISELKGLQGVFEGHSPKISATKSMTGHLLGAAGAIEAIASIMTVKDGIIPPTINTTKLDEAVPAGLDIVLGQAQEVEVNVAMSNTFGFGGHNAITVFKKFES